MRYIADTTYLIDLINGDAKAVDIAKELDSYNERLALSVISVEEYLRGIHYLYYDKKKILKEKLARAERELHAFNILPFTYETALIAAHIEAELTKKGEMISLPDIIIGSTALYHNLTLITRNTKHFKKIQNLLIREY